VSADALCPGTARGERAGRDRHWAV
jgi:hypothetical protein